uniref:Uncharacterized protein n=1 Tax=Anguilla anguilla TaxID=7936 RepID=A0A0E9QN91_ANGAN
MLLDIPNWVESGGKELKIHISIYNSISKCMYVPLARAPISRMDWELRCIV